MMLRMIESRWAKWVLISVTMMFGFLPGGCETTILRLATPFLI
jgi:hypothetical protein